MSSNFDESNSTISLPQGISINEYISRRLYTAPELMRLTGMTRKQVSYWAQIGLIIPTFRDSHTKSRKSSLYYAGVEVVKALIVCELRKRGFSPRQVQQVARNLRERGIQLHESEAYLLTDGYSVYYAYSDGEVVDVLKHHSQMLLLVPLHEQIAKLLEVA